MNRTIFIVFFIFVIFRLNCEVFISKEKFYFYFENINKNDLNLLIDEINRSESFFLQRFDYVPKEFLDVKIMSSTGDMLDKLKIPYWIGGYYSDYNVFLQPVNVLIKKNVLKKVVFIEYAHYFIDSFTNNNCPSWFNEMISKYFYIIYSNEKIDFNYKPKILLKYIDFVDINKNIRNKDLMNEFNDISLKFVFFLQKEYGTNFIYDVLSKMKNNLEFNNLIKKKTGKSIEEVYETDFLRYYD